MRRYGGLEQFDYKSVTHAQTGDKKGPTLNSQRLSFALSAVVHSRCQESLAPLASVLRGEGPGVRGLAVDSHCLIYLKYTELC
jgi:hypothetical protein